MLLSLEGDDHARLKRLLMPAFRNSAITAMRPRFQALAGELVDGFAPRGEVEFIKEFAEPYAARILCQSARASRGPLGSRWRTGPTTWASRSAIGVKDDLPRIEAALAGLHGYLDDVVADRSRRTRRTTWSRPCSRPQEADGALTRHELGVSLVFLAFAGMETTRNQLGLALQTLLAHPDQWRLLAERPRARRRRPSRRSCGSTPRSPG